MLEFANFLSPEHVIQSGGLLLIGAMIFAETGLLVGIFFPGDTLLIAAGVFAATGKLSIGWLLAVVVIAAIVGYEVGYRIGERLGPKMFKRQEGVLFRKEYVEKTEEFFDKYGKVTLILARFIANVRTFVSLLAGAGKMDKRTFFLFNVLGAIVWGVGVTMLGYAIGSSVPNIDHYIIPLLIIVLFVMYSIIMWHILKDSHRREHFWTGLKSDMRYIFGKKA